MCGTLSKYAICAVMKQVNRSLRGQAGNLPFANVVHSPSKYADSKETQCIRPNTCDDETSNKLYKTPYY